MNYLSHHFIKFELWNGSWKTFDHVSPNRLQRLLSKFNPKNSYLSVNKFALYQEKNPSYENIIMQRNGFIDIDGQNFENKEECKEYFTFIVSFLKMKEIEIKEMIKTNDEVGGYQIVTEAKDFNRLEQLKKIFPVTFNKIDKRVDDEKRVRRMPFTLNGNRSNTIAVPVNELGDELVLPDHLRNHPKLFNRGLEHNQETVFSNRHLKHLFSSESYNNDDSPRFYSHGMPMADDRGQVAIKGAALPTRHKNPAEGDIVSTLPRHYLLRQMKNVVFLKSDCLVPVIKSRKEFSVKHLKKLQKTYAMGDIYHFLSHHGHFYISPKIMSKNRLMKVYRAFKAWSSLSELQKYNQNWFPISNCYNMDTFASLPTFSYNGIYMLDNTGSYSKPHSEWLSHYFYREYPNLTGGEPRAFLAEFKRD